MLKLNKYRINYKKILLGIGLAGVSSYALSQTNLALNKTVTASPRALLAAGNAIDGNPGTRWESIHGSSPALFQVDLGSVQALGAIQIDWEAANAQNYEVLGSTNGVNWTPLTAVTGGVFGNRSDRLSISGSYRYLKFNFASRSVGNYWGFSIWELKVFGPSTTTETAKNLMQYASATASEGALRPAANAIDKGLNSNLTQWESAHGSDNAYLEIDLGSNNNLHSLSIDWESANASQYKIFGLNALNQTPVEIANLTGGIFGNRNDFVALQGTYRYVRIQGVARSAGNYWGYSIYDVRIYGYPTTAHSSAGSSNNSSVTAGVSSISNVSSVSSVRISSSRASMPASASSINSSVSSNSNASSLSSATISSSHSSVDTPITSSSSIESSISSVASSSSSNSSISSMSSSNISSSGSSVDSSSVSSLANTSSSSRSSSALSSDRNRYDAPKATNAPTIDGIEESSWDKAAWAPIDTFWLGSQNPTAQDFSGRYKAMWDANYLYLLFDITDDVILDATTNPLERYWDDDCVEIFIDENKNGGNHQYNTSAWAYHISTQGDTVDFTNSRSVALLNQHIDVRKISTGNKHIWEMRVRIFGENYSDGGTNIPLILSAGKLMGFSASYNDNDISARRESMMGSVDTQGHKNDMGYIDASVFGTMLLTE